MTPAQVVADLDLALAECGEDIRLQRLTGTQQIPYEVKCRAFVRGYTPAEMIGSSGATQQSSKVILSPSEIIAKAWTSGRPAGDDQRIPMSGNKAMVAGRGRSVEAAVGIYMGDDLVRIEMMVK